VKKQNIETIIKANQSIRLDIGCGDNKMPGFVGIDILDLPSVDIVWNIERTPWPLPAECASQAICSHLLEHLNPTAGDARLGGLVELLVDKKLITQNEADDYMGLPGSGFINVMNEIWRVLKPGAQFAFVVPYATSPGFAQDPTHINMINQTTMMYFDPLHPSGLYQFYRPKPWKIQEQYYQTTGNLECVLVKRPMDPSYLGKPNYADIAQEHAGKLIDLRSE
jgi:SAM-dependent methyltransferase